MAGQSRLRLDPVEVLAERVATLESAASAPVSSSARDSQDVQRLQTLEDSVKTLVALAGKNEASLLDLAAPRALRPASVGPIQP